MRSAKEFEGGYLLRIKISRYKNHTTVTFSYKRPSFSFSFLAPLGNYFSRSLRTALGPALVVIGVIGIMSVLHPYLEGFLPKVRTDTVFSYAPVAASAQEPKTVLSLPRSEPTRLHIPSLQISAETIHTTVDERGELLAPSEYDVAAWYVASPTPGEIGPSVIVGHLDGPSGEAVFSRLHTVGVGADIVVYRADKSRALFTVTQVIDFSQSDFPANEVYGDTTHPELRIITCSGDFNFLTGRYTKNTVVFAKLNEVAMHEDKTVN